MIDRLLASPRYGEKWGRHWLDLVRFAETNSYERDGRKPNAWRYRDYVIRAFNDDKPYDRFLREQLAGDEMPDGGADGIIATGYYRLGIWDDEPTDREQARYDGLDDIVATTGQVFLGLTFDCARCHDHKIDPIPQKDYYRLLSFFHNINHYRNGGPTDEALIDTDPAGKRAYEERVRTREQKREELQAALTAFETDFRKLYEQVQGRRVEAGEVRDLVRANGAKLLGVERYSATPSSDANCKRCCGRRWPAKWPCASRKPAIARPIRSSSSAAMPHVKGDKVEPAFPDDSRRRQARHSDAAREGEDERPASGSGELDRFAGQSDDRARHGQSHLAIPLRSRHRPFVEQLRLAGRPPNASRIARLVGRGVRFPSPQPSPPLGGEGRVRGWSMKSLHRLLLTSNAYRMSSRPNDKALSVDPVNDLVLAFRHAPLDGRGSPRFDPGSQRHVELEDVRFRRFHDDPA